MHPAGQTVPGTLPATPEGCAQFTGPRAVPARSATDGTRTFSLSEHSDLFLCAASQDGSRSDQELDGVLRAPETQVNFLA
jgi:hypothetical protein